MIFGRKNSIIVPFDYLDSKSFEDFEDQLEAIEEHYRFSKLSQITESIFRKKKQGFASIVLENPRKGVFLHAVPVLLAKNIPFTVFIDPDLLGVNRLPIHEELAAFHRAYPEKFSEDQLLTWREVARTNPLEADRFLKESRKTLGPLKIEELDSLQFFTTWGKVVDLPPALVEYGLVLNQKLSGASELEKKLKFAEIQTKTKIRFLRAPKWGLSEAEKQLFKDLGFEGALGHQVNEVTNSTSHFNLPIWALTKRP